MKDKIPEKYFENMVIQPLRFVDAVFNFTPLQEDILMLIQKQMTKSKNIQTSFRIDLKPYLKGKGLDLKNVRYGHYDKLSKELLKSVVSFKYLKGDKMFVNYNLFKNSSVDKDFFLYIEIIEDVLPLFYINKLKEGHFKDSKLVKEAFESSFPEYDNYVSIPPKTFIEFDESSVKSLYRKLLEHRKRKVFDYEFTKDELYQVFGYGYIQMKKEKNLFGIHEQEFIQNKYIGTEGWKTLSKQLNKWLEIINNHPESGLSIKTHTTGKKNKFYKTKGRPIRSIFIDVHYDQELIKLSIEQQKIFMDLNEYGLSEKQKYSIMKDFDLDQILPMIKSKVVRMRDPNTKIVFYGEFERMDNRKIQNVPGYIYAYVFKYSKEKK